VQDHEPGLARSTVYRALDALAASGAVHVVRLGDGPLHYEIAGEEHQHAVCSMCEGVLHIEDALVHELEHHLEELHHFRPMRTEVLVVGVCDACARSRGRRPAKRRLLEHVHYPPADTAG
jgi:Fur family ferric uptake transcriptional regulator